MRPDLWSRAIDVWYRATGRDSDFRCPHCAYELRGLPAPRGVYRCPECGAVTERSKALVPREPITWWHRWRVPVVVAAALAGVLLSVVLHPLFMFVAPLAVFVLFKDLGPGPCGFAYRRRAFEIDDPPVPPKDRLSRSRSPGSMAADRALAAALKKTAPGTPQAVDRREVGGN